MFKSLFVASVFAAGALWAQERVEVDFSAAEKTPLVEDTAASEMAPSKAPSADIPAETQVPDSALEAPVAGEISEAVADASAEAAPADLQVETVKEIAVKDLATAIKRVLAEHPEIAAARKAHESASVSIGVAEGEFLPSVDLLAGYGPEETENTSTENDGDQHRSRVRFDGSVVIRQNLYTGGRISSALDRYMERASEAGYDLLDTKENRSLRAIEAYLGVCQNRALLELAQKNVEVHRDILRTVEERQKRGMSRESDVIQVKGRLALAQAQQQREIANKEAVAAEFYEAIGVQPDSDLAEPVPVTGLLPASLEEARRLAEIQHPLLNARKHNIKAAQAVVREAEAAFRPEFYLEGRVSERDDVGGVIANDDEYSLLLRMDWNIFRGGSDKAAKLSRILDVEQSEDLYTDESRKVSRNVAVSWHDYRGTLVELNYFLQHEKATSETIKAYREQYKLNQRTLFDLLNAQNELFLASSRVIETTYTKFLTSYRIFADMGNISAQIIKAGEEM
jgi:adhesin transport system outer membrane protein